jgi:hypothetical protein
MLKPMIVTILLSAVVFGGYIAITRWMDEMKTEDLKRQTETNALIQRTQEASKKAEQEIKNHQKTATPWQPLGESVREKTQASVARTTSGTALMETPVGILTIRGIGSDCLNVGATNAHFDYYGIENLKKMLKQQYRAKCLFWY